MVDIATLLAFSFVVLIELLREDHNVASASMACRWKQDALRAAFDRNVS